MVLLVSAEGARHPVAATPDIANAVARSAALVILLLYGGGRLRCAVLGLVIVIAAWSGGALQAGSPAWEVEATCDDRWSPSHRNETSGYAVLRLRAAPRRRAGDNWSAPAAVLDWRPDDGVDVGVADGAVMLRASGPAPDAGAVVAARVRRRPPRRARLPGGFDERLYLRGRSLAAVHTVSRSDTVQTLNGGGMASVLGRHLTRWRSSLARRLESGLPPREARVATSILLGGGLDATVREAYVRVGLAHLFALSGLHVGIIAGLMLLLLRPLRPGPVTRVALVVPFLWTYALLVGLPGSVVRAVGVVSLALMSQAAGRRGDGLRLLGLVFWVNVVWQPWALLDVGVQLSYLAAGGIVAGQRVTKRLLAATRGPWRAIGSSLAVTMSAQLATLPVVARAFGVLPLAGPLVNLVAVPVFAMAASTLACGLLLSLVWPWAAEGLFATGAVIMRGLAVTTAELAPRSDGMVLGFPQWSLGRTAVHGGLLATVALGLVASRHRQSNRPGWLIVVACYVAMLVNAATRTSSNDAVQVWQMDVDQGDSAVVRFADGWTAVIDTGPRWRSGGGPFARDVLPWLRRRGVRRLDTVALTHAHDDHTGGAAALGRALAVDRWVVGGTTIIDSTWCPLRPQPGDTLHADGEWILVALHPGSDDELELENDRSLVLGLVCAGELRGLWTGDLESAGEVALLPRLPPVPPGGLDVLKAGHHGSRTSGSAALVGALRPQLVVVSCGIENRHHHPSHGPYAAAGDTARVLRTDLAGAIWLRWSRSGQFAASPTLPGAGLP